MVIEEDYLEFDNAESWDLVLCPHCHGTYTHHDKVKVFARDEDAKEGLKVIVANKRAGICSDLTGNPSGRRDGLVVSIWCEDCSGKHEIEIFQHKGQTFIRTILLEEKHK